jgi:ribosome-associated protein
MQPNIRMYYNLEELWGEKPVRLKLGAAKPVGAPATRVAPAPVAAKSAASLRRSSAAKKGVEEAFPSRAQMQKNALAKAVADKKAAAKFAAKPRSTSLGAAPAIKPRVKVLVVNAPAKPSTKSVAKKAAASKTAAKPAAAKRVSALKA